MKKLAKNPPCMESVILDSINEGVFTVNADFEITSFNRAAEKITGVSRKRAVGRPCCDVFRANICETRCALRKTFDSGKPVINATAHIYNHKNFRIPIRLSTTLLRDGSGKVVGGAESFQDITQIEELQKKLTERYGCEDIIGQSPRMKKIFDLLPQIAGSPSHILLEGASGTGKELFARALHNLSGRQGKPFVAVNCAALPENLLESELFGHTAGAFTDARKDKPGRFALADGGTLFLDEIGDISPALQVRLLRVIQERVIEPLGSVKPRRVDVRIITATHRDLASLVRKGTFREDLFYRINVVPLHLPPLKDRREDIPLLVQHFISKQNILQNREVEGVSPEVMTVLMDYDFPGNIRELENMIERAFVFCTEKIIERVHLPPGFQNATPEQSERPVMTGRIRDVEKDMIEKLLKKHDGRRAKVADEMGIHASTLYRKILSYGIKPPERDGRYTRSVSGR